MKELLILVDESDREIGALDKLSVHKTGRLHRAFSIFIFNTEGKLLLQQRAEGKYHSAGLWSNSCCSHPRSGENMQEAVDRRLKEEMGLQCNTDFIFNFIYKMQFENGLTEHEFDHVYFGTSDDIPSPNWLEVKAWKYISLKNLKEEIDLNPQDFSAWLKICLPKITELKKLKK